MATRGKRVRSGVSMTDGVTLGRLGRKLASLLERYPDADDIRIVSGNDGDHGALSHHYGGMQYLGSPTAALDIICEAPRAAEKMRDLANWLYDNYADCTVELIHTYESGKSGAYVKNQKKYPDGSVYGGPSAIGHEDRIHWATSEALVERAQRSRSADAGPLAPPAGLVPGPGEPADVVGIANTAPVWGWDASNNDWDPKRGPMDLVSAQRDGISFFTHKATEGSTYKDPYFKQALERARAAGIPVLGCYHYLWPDDIEEQVNTWMDYVEAQTPWWKDVPWIWQVDAEKDGVPRPPTPEEIGRAVATVKRRMEIQGTRGYVIVYAPHWLYENSLGAGYDVWNSYYVGSGSPRRFKEQYQGVGDRSAGWDLMSGRVPRILQFASDGVVGRQNTCDVNKFNGDLHELIRLCGRDPGRIGTPVTHLVATRGPEKVLSYDHSDAFLRQEKYWDCGPAAAQIVLKALGIDASETTLIAEIGTTENGTDCVQLIERVLNRRLPGANYRSVELYNDPPTAVERDVLWNNIVRSIDAGYGVVMNWEVPPGNYPIGVKGSVSPSYRQGTYWHYVACMGYDSTSGRRAVWIADGGFSPHEYWISFDQAATLIPPKAYAFATVGSRTQPVCECGKPQSLARTRTLASRVDVMQVGDGTDWEQESQRHDMRGLLRQLRSMTRRVEDLLDGAAGPSNDYWNVGESGAHLDGGQSVHDLRGCAISGPRGQSAAALHAVQAPGRDFPPESLRPLAPINPGPPTDRAVKIGDVTGPGYTDRFGMAATDLGVMTRTPTGRILAIFGDTFRDACVGGGDWRGTVGLISDTKNLDEGLVWTRAAGPDPNYARQLRDYPHVPCGKGASTVLPSDVITIGNTIYLHTTAHFPFGNPSYGEIWKSTDDGRTWSQHGPRLDTSLHGGLAQLWTWDIGDDGFVYILSTGFGVDRDRPIILRRVPADKLHDPTAYRGWGWGRDVNGLWGWDWGREPSPVIDGGFGEMSLRRIDGQWVLVAFNARDYRLDIRVFPDFENCNLKTWPTTSPIRGGAWGRETADSVAQLYGPSIIPGSRPGSGFHILLSQWRHLPGEYNPSGDWPYHAMQFKIPVPIPRQGPTMRASGETPQREAPRKTAAPKKAVTKTAAKKPAAKKTAAKKTAAKKTAAKKTAAKKVLPRKETGKP